MRSSSVSAFIRNLAKIFKISLVFQKSSLSLPMERERNYRAILLLLSASKRQRCLQISILRNKGRDNEKEKQDLR
jgi:hypothetical protein